MASFFVNALRVNFESVLSMHNARMATKQEIGHEGGYRLLHDIVAKSLSVKADSFDVVMTENFEMMVTISAGLKVNWGHILFQTLDSMVYACKQSQGYVVPLSILLEKLVKGP
ncbi:hypothetical protein F511_24612 [Dorcoceras hygrometricum]|uniref:Uncharacterized protein n=1 Tax=Dorcoceras hygrometricum TaxID=472368 RepID=A0A2Z7B9I8_9LAMI|nr:hypothetical protein F511_24612 [Dorcoceras hygrometricum]